MKNKIEFIDLDTNEVVVKEASEFWGPTDKVEPLSDVQRKKNRREYAIVLTLATVIGTAIVYIALWPLMSIM